MCSSAAQERYPEQWAAALSADGIMVHMDHNAIDNDGHVITTGPHVPIANTSQMKVVPQETEIQEMLARGPFRVVTGPFVYPFYQLGYAVVYQVDHSRKSEEDIDILSAADG